MLNWLLLALTLPSAEDPIELGSLQVTGGRVEQSTFEAANAVTVVDRDAIEAEIPQVVTDALRGVPGVFVQQTTPGQGIPIVRGLKGSEVLHLVDGIRLNNAFFRNAPNQYIALVDAALIERIEVLRGPASTLYGADAMGGVVQFLTRRPEYDAAGGMVRLRGASADQSIGGSAAWAQGTEDLAWRVQASYLDVGDRQPGAGPRIEPSGYESRALAGTVRWRAGETGEWLLDLQHLEQPSTPRVDELVPGFGQTAPASAEFYFEPNKRSSAHLQRTGTLEQRFADGFQVHAAWQRLVDGRRNRELGSTERRLESNTSDQVGVTAQFDLAWGHSQLVYGAEIYRDEVASARRAVDLETGQEQPISSRFPDGSTQTSTAVYARNEWFLTAGSVQAGLRYSRFDVDIAGRDGADQSELDLDELTANIGGTWYLTPTLNLVGNIGQGFRAPNIFDLATLGPRPGNRFNVANPDLGPEHLTSVDLGLKWANADTEAEIFAWRARFEDKIDSVVTGEVFEGRTVVRSENLNQVDLHGIEIGARHRLSPDDRLWGALNWTHGTEEQPDGSRSAADRVPPLAGEIGWRRAMHADLSADAFVRFALRQDRLSDRDVRDPRINPEGTPGWATLNLRVNWSPAPQWRVTGALENLLDRDYREHGSGIDAPGRNLKLAVEWRF